MNDSQQTRTSAFHLRDMIMVMTHHVLLHARALPICLSANQLFFIGRMPYTLPRNIHWKDMLQRLELLQGCKPKGTELQPGERNPVSNVNAVSTAYTPGNLLQGLPGALDHYRLEFLMCRSKHSQEQSMEGRRQQTHAGSRLQISQTS